MRIKYGCIFLIHGLNIAEAINYGTKSCTVKPAVTFCGCRRVGRIARSKFIKNKNEKKFPETKKKEYKCQNCDKAFFYKNNYSSHLVIHGIRQFPCRNLNCKKTFLRRNDEVKHHKFVHLSNDKVECDIENCGKLIDRRVISRHKKEMHGERNIAECDRCQRKMLKRNLTNHFKRCN